MPTKTRPSNLMIDSNRKQRLLLTVLMSQLTLMLPFSQLRLLIRNHKHLALVHSGRLSYGMLQVHCGMYASNGNKNKDHPLGFGKCELYEEDSNNAVHYHIPYCANQEGNLRQYYLDSFADNLHTRLGVYKHS